MSGKLPEFLLENEESQQPLFETRWLMEDMEARSPKELDTLIEHFNTKIMGFTALRAMAIDVKENGYGVNNV